MALGTDPDAVELWALGGWAREEHTEAAKPWPRREVVQAGRVGPGGRWCTRDAWAQV